MRSKLISYSTRYFLWILNAFYYHRLYYFDVVLHHVYFGCLYSLVLLTKQIHQSDAKNSLLLVLIGSFHAVDFYLSDLIYRPHLVKYYGKSLLKSQEEERKNLKREKKKMKKQTKL